MSCREVVFREAGGAQDVHHGLAAPAVLGLAGLLQHVQIGFQGVLGDDGPVALAFQALAVDRDGGFSRLFHINLIDQRYNGGAVRFHRLEGLQQIKEVEAEIPQVPCAQGGQIGSQGFRTENQGAVFLQFGRKSASPATGGDPD